MSKYKYRATEFNEVDWTVLRSKVPVCARVIFAVDVAKVDFVVTLLTADRRVLKSIKWSHPQQTRAVVAQAAALGTERVEAVMEPTGTYGDALRGLLKEAGIVVYRVSPKRVHDAAELYDGVPSLHDAKAAYLIGRLHLEGVSQRWREASEQRRDLQAQLKLLGFYQERRQRACNRLEALLARHWPEAPYCLGLDSVSLLKLLCHYGSAAAVAAAPGAASELLRRTGGHFLRSEKCDALLASARTTVGVPATEGERGLIQVLAEELLEVHRRCRLIEKRLEVQVGTDAGLERQAEVIGRVSAVVLRSALGEPGDYPNAASYVKAAGLNLKERSSGKHKGRLKITKRGPSVVRFYDYFAVLRLIRHEGPAKRWYEAKVARDGGTKSKALTALMRKLLKALWHVGRGATFDEAQLFGERSLAPAA
ncbi:IS110 family transposase [Sedimenticola hydrogenitrophicus]|uniref:IS110 family transposase n=1 Tax=Sedimenticola hydrogenitrophicus TaxID=2967975 RepID=UPI0023AF4156|nr:transposase [Sedimenticola hydrogenitrophicus]